jgi:hypothetical protein
MTTYLNPFSGDVIVPTDVSFVALSLSVDTYLEWPVNGNDTNNVAARIIQVTNTVTGIDLYMPPANQVSVGTDSLIRNMGANPFTVRDVGGNTIVSIGVGEAKYIYVTNNSTENGVWGVIAFGAGSSTADSATLAGYGLKAISFTLNTAHPVSLVASDYTISDSDRASLITWSGGVGTVTLPVAASLGDNFFFMLRNSGTGVVTVTTSGTDRIDGDITQDYQLTESAMIVCSGGSWYTVGRGRNTEFAFTQLSYAVTNGTYTLSTDDASNVIQVYTGTLTGNVEIVLPSVVQVYYVSNQTTGPYTFTLKTSAVGGETVTIDQDNQAILTCDGTNVLNASTSLVGSVTISFSDGSPANPSIRFATDLDTGFYHPASNQIGVTANGSNVATFKTTGLDVVGNVSAGGTGNFVGGILGGTF